MEATRDHISLETAKLLEDCGVNSKNVYAPQNRRYSFNYSVVSKKELDKIIFRQDINDYLAFTWQEILWENADKFFSNEYIYCGGYSLPAYKEQAKNILLLLQQKKYKEADLYFRKHCVLIKKD